MAADTLETFRAVSSILGVLAAIALGYRTVSTWPDISVLSRALAVVLGLVMLVQAYGSTRTLTAGIPLPVDVVSVLFATRLSVLGLALWWPFRR